MDRKPDVLLLDVQMPELEEVDVTRALRCDDQMGTCPVILISSLDECEVAWREAAQRVVPLSSRTRLS